MPRNPTGAPGRSRMLVVALILVAGLAGSHEARTQSFGEAVDVRVVNVDVFVTDKKGNPIEGLTRDDFVLYEDGVEVEISNFYAGVASPAGSPEPAADEARAAGGELPLLDPERPPLWAVVYLDNFSLDPADRTRILGDLERFASSQADADVRFMLVTNDLGLDARTPFTRDPAVLAAAIEEAGEGSAVGVQERVEFRTVLSSLQGYIELYTDNPRACPGDPCECAWQQMIESWRVYAASASGRVNVSLNGLGELVSSLGGLQGRKAVFYVSSGLAQNPGQGVLKYLGDLCPHLEHNTTQEMWKFDETSRLEELSARANANRVTLYPLDGGGLRSDDGTTVDFASRRFRPSNLTSRIRTANLQSTLLFLADQTGGRAVINANQPFDDLTELATDFDSFYSLGFSPARDPDGDTHTLRVALREKSRAELRFRQAYRDKPLDERLGDRLMTTLRFGVRDNPLAVSGATGPPEPADGKLFEVPVLIRVPAGKLVTAGREGAGGRVRVFIAAQDERGRRTPVKEKLIDLPAETSGEHVMIVTMRLRRGPHQIAIGVRDEVGVEVSLLRIDVDVEPGEAVAAAAES